MKTLKRSRREAGGCSNFLTSSGSTMMEEKRQEGPREVGNSLNSLVITDRRASLTDDDSKEAESAGKDVNINKAPGDFVVVRGQAYKMSKATPSSDVIPTDSSVHHSPEIMAFKEALQSAETRVSKQTEDLKKQSSRIDDLEQFIVQNADKLGGVQILKDLGLDNVSLRESGSNPTGSGGKPRLGLAARRRAESLKSGVYELNVSTAVSPSIDDDATTNDTPSVSAHSEINYTATSIVGVSKHGTEDDISPISAANNYSHDLITPIAADKVDVLERGASFSDGVDNMERVKTSPPVIRRSHSDGQSYSSPPSRTVSDQNTELDTNHTDSSGSSSINRTLSDSAKKEKRDQRKQAELLEMSDQAEDPSPAKAPPKGLAARLSMGSQERRKLNERKRQSSSENLRALDSSTTPQRGGKAPNSAGSERSLDIPGSRASSASSNTSTLRHTRASSPSTTFNWSGQDDPDAAPHLFVAHDNPQLGQTVATSLRASGISTGSSSNNSSNGSYSTSTGMGFMLESKDESGLNVFITGTIKYSGPFEHIEGSTLDGDMARGSQCLVGVDMVGYCVNMKTVTTRPRGELIEIDLYPDKKDKSDKGKTSSSVKAAEAAVTRVTLNSKKALRTLLKTCKGRVDLILDPYQTDQKWFPYWEGRRKMAPQFRSRGIGYLRLGDDMSNYGSAFLSLDAGASYLDDGASGAVASNASTPLNNTSGACGWQGFSRGGSSGSGSSSRPTSNSDSFYSSAGRQIDSGSASATPSSHGGEDAVPYTDGTHPNSRGNSAGSGGGFAGGIALIHEFGGAALDRQPGSPDEDVATEEELREIIARLRDPDMKWADRTQNLQRLVEVGVSCAGASERSATFGTADNTDVAVAVAVVTGDKVVMDTISVIRDTLMKQNNPHVLKSALRCLPTISHGVRHRASCAVAWKSLLLESIHMIRTVAKVCEEARIALDYLHSGGQEARHQPCLSLSQLSGHFEEIILGPRGKGTAGKGASNTCKVIQWLQSIGSAELHASVMALATLDTHHFRPSVYERVDIGMLFKKSKSTFQHREADTREAMVNLSSILITLDVLQVTVDARSFTSLTTTLTISSEDTHEATILKAISTSCASGLAEMKKHAHRMYAKVISATARQLLTSAQVLESEQSNGNGAEEQVQSRALSNQSGSPPLSGSLAAKSGARSRGSSRGADGFSVSPGDRYSGGSRGGSRGGSAVMAPSGMRGSGAGGNSAAGTPRAAPSSPSTGTQAGRSELEKSKLSQAPSPSSVSAGDTNSVENELSNSWYEVRMMLRVLPTTSSSWNNLVAVAQGCDVFVEDLTDAAHKVGVTRAMLLRAVLPFDESTSSNDQSKIASPDVKAGSILSQLGPHEADALREKAVGLRKAVRIKMADEADLRQAIAAADMLRTFCTKVDKLSSLTEETAVHIIKKLESRN